MNNIILGTMNIAYPHSSNPNATVEEYKKIIETYLYSVPSDFAILDTAYYYANTKCEQILGTILHELPYLPKISTKLNPWFNNDFTNGKLGQLSTQGIMNQFTTSLKNLNVDNVEYLFLHCPDYDTPLEETLHVCDSLWRKEKFNHFGISNYSLSQTKHLLDVCEDNGYVCPSIYQGMYNIISRKVEEIFPLLCDYHMNFWAYNPLAGGLLTGKYISSGLQEDSRFKGNTIYQNIFWKPEILTNFAPFFEKGSEICTKQSFDWLQYYSKMRENDKIILGVSNVNQLENNIKNIASDKLISNNYEVLNKMYSSVIDISPNYYY